MAKTHGGPERLPWFKVRALEHLDLAAGIPLAAVGLAHVLRCRQWVRGSLPESEAELARMARVPLNQFRAAWPHIADQFPLLAPGVRGDPELSEEREEAVSKGRKAREAALARWDREPAKSKQINGTEDADAERMQSGGNAEETRIDETRTDETSTARRRLPPPSSETDTTTAAAAAAVETIAQAMPELYRDAFREALREATTPRTLLAELQALHASAPGGAPGWSWADIGHALHDMAVAGAPVRPKVLEAFLRRLDTADAPIATSQPEPPKLQRLRRFN